MNIIALHPRHMEAGPVVEMELIHPDDAPTAFLDAKHGGWFRATFRDGTVHETYASALLILDTDRIGVVAA